MQTNEAHDIVNPEINEDLRRYKLLENREDRFSLDLLKFYNGKLKGIILMESSEIEFLEKLSLRRIKREDQRLQALKISTAHLKAKEKQDGSNK